MLFNIITAQGNKITHERLCQKRKQLEQFYIDNQLTHLLIIYLNLASQIAGLRLIYIQKASLRT